MEEFVNKREKLMKAHEERMLDLKRRHFDEKMALEKEFDEEFNKLMEEYTPSGSKQDYSKPGNWENFSRTWDSEEVSSFAFHVHLE